MNELREHNKKAFQLKIYKALNDFNTKQSMGGYWIDWFRTMIIPYNILATASVWQITFWAIHVNIPFWVILVAITLKTYVMYLIKYIAGEKVRKIGLWKYSNEYNAKQEHLSPFNKEIKETLESICEKVGAESKFKDL